MGENSVENKYLNILRKIKSVSMATVDLQNCIDSGCQYSIQQEHCLHCGLCYEICPVKAVKRRAERC